MARKKSPVQIRCENLLRSAIAHTPTLRARIAKMVAAGESRKIATAWILTGVVGPCAVREFGRTVEIRDGEERVPMYLWNSEQKLYVENPVWLADRQRRRERIARNDEARRRRAQFVIISTAIDRTGRVVPEQIAALKKRLEEQR